MKMHSLCMTQLTFDKTFMFSLFLEIGQFVLIPLRVEPENALKELDSLYDVYTEIKKIWNVEVKY